MNGLKQWGKAAAVRAAKTWAQSALAIIGANTVSVTALDWPQIVGIACTAAVVSVLTSVAGLPEVGDGASVRELKAAGDGD